MCVWGGGLEWIKDRELCDKRVEWRMRSKDKGKNCNMSGTGRCGDEDGGIMGEGS